MWSAAVYLSCEEGDPVRFERGSCCRASQGLAQAKLAYKKANAVPVTKKDAKDQRPTGRGGFGVGRGRDAGGRAPYMRMRMSSAPAIVQLRPGDALAHTCT